MLAALAPLASGLLFGLGLTLGQMVDPAKVLGFLDIGALPAGGWDPSLAFVMGGALAVTALGYRLAFARGRPFAAPQFQLPQAQRIDARLAAGAVLFGIGWGLVGYCPGPALAALVFGHAGTVLFVVAMLAGMALHRFTLARAAPQPPASRPLAPVR
jgi:uncharacterized membrane protein YedE/YeeE